MGLIDAILNLTGLLLWLGWRSLHFDPLIRTTPATLVGTLRRAEPRRARGWQFLAALALLLVLRAWLYQQVGKDADWTPRVNLSFVVLAFRSNPLPQTFLSTLLFSILSFARVFILCYFWLLALLVINRRSTDPDPLHKMLRQHLGPLARWPWLLQVILPLLVVTGLWVALHPLLVQLEVAGRVASNGHLVAQGVLVATALYLSLQYLLPVVLLLYLVASYVYLGTNPFWEFVGTTSRNLLAPLRGLPLRFARFDFTPVAGVVLICLLLYGLPRLILSQLALHHLSAWPQ